MPSPANRTPKIQLLNESFSETRKHPASNQMEPFFQRSGWKNDKDPHIKQKDKRYQFVQVSQELFHKAHDTRLPLIPLRNSLPRTPLGNSFLHIYTISIMPLN